MASYNRIVIMGNLTRDPEYKQLTSGQAVCRLGLASNRQFKNRQTGTQVQEVCFVDVDVWGAQAESCRQYLQKGRAVLVEGRLKFDSWEDPEGKTRSKHSIVADRVVFLASASQTADTEQATEQDTASGVAPIAAARLDNEAHIDEALQKQIKAIKARQKSAAEAPKADAVPTAPAAAFTDEPPFQDDLPF